jgi:hypothetical protein
MIIDAHDKNYMIVINGGVSLSHQDDSLPLFMVFLMWQQVSNLYDSYIDDNQLNKMAKY